MRWLDLRSARRSVLTLTGAALIVAFALPVQAGERRVSGKKLLLQRSVSPAQVKARLSLYPKVSLGVPKHRIPHDIKKMLPHIRVAADAIDRVYWQQMSSNGLQMRAELQKMARFEKNATAADFLRLLGIHYGPWDRHHDDARFLGTRTRPAGANFYPRDVSKREIDQWLAKKPAVRPKVYNPYTVIRRTRKGLTTVPYSKAFSTDLKKASKALTAAAAAHRCVEKKPAAEGAAPVAKNCRCQGLADFLKARARSFQDDSYLTSEILWLETGDCPLDLAIGPYEFYEDRLLGLKTSFEAIVYLRDERESKRFVHLMKHHQALIENLPIPPDLRPRFEMLKPSRITVGNVLYTAGDARSGYQIRAFVLPNDQSVRSARGTKNVILKNVVKAKFDALAKPVARRVFGTKLFNQVTFQAYFDILLAWQFAHGVQAMNIEQPDGSKTTARKLLRARYTLMELVKGEAIALLNYAFLRNKGVFPKNSDAAMAATFLASFFDASRLARSSPQTIAKAVIYNYLAKEWVFRYNPTKRTFEVNPPALQPAVRKLVAEVLQIIARGDYAGAGRLIIQYGILPGEVHDKLNELGNLPVDISPMYTSMPE